MNLVKDKIICVRLYRQVPPAGLPAVKYGYPQKRVPPLGTLFV